MRVSLNPVETSCAYCEISLNCHSTSQLIGTIIVLFDKRTYICDEILLRACAMTEVKIPKVVKTNKAGYEFISNLYPIIVNDSQHEVLIDFTQCNSFDGNLAAALGAILDKVVNEGKQVFLNRPKIRTVRRVLSRNHFLRAWAVQTDVEDKENHVEYKRFASNGKSEEFKRYIDNGLVQKIRFPKHTNKVGESIIENIFEIYVNAITHGETDYVYSCGEYKEDDNTLEMTIVDCGKTIPGNVNNYFSSKGKTIINSCDAIEWAFISGNTTKLQTGGLGLAILKEFIKLNNGAIQVVSGSGMIEFTGNKTDRFLLCTDFPGTIVNMKFNFDDPKTYLMKSEREHINMNDLL